MTSKFYAIISGAGSGTGRAVALRFAKSYPIVLLSRSQSSYQPIVDDIRAAGGQALGFAADASDPAAVDAAFTSVAKEWPDRRLAAAIYNANAGFANKPFLELTEADLDTSLGTAAKGLFYFAQKTMPLLLSTVNADPPNPPTLLVTGATASLRGSVRFATFAAGKFAQRAITQSLAREFGPQGVHVALAIIDGGIDTPWGRELGLVEVTKDSKLKPEAIAESYWHLHTQHRSAFTQELDLRPFSEKF
ncbi:Sepiapterin reductase-like protein [Hapsidospora chrysogenum ATCC 11550]|uniref:Sepiapterin reductase-like protein n=1 Tax=Hapsidospora chrysogenum (strain ATCC 11550 / CBS 779.69 / DSM 880 / IAM 14645 / JCM 23072 / IMI 49137) TaxID=857340 RepID=A0A086TFW0_HAPC1|nr:Sepiapterin reductase-like protein [Hapsidospora chrysogenum ATCC 11550]